MNGAPEGRSSYGFYKNITEGYEEAAEKVKKSLQEEGFGVLTEIDVKETLKKKLDVIFRPYKILGACNPPYAYQALQCEEQIGLMLPCNVIIYENDEGTTTVAAVDPVASMMAVENSRLKEVAEDIRKKLQRVVSSL